MLTAYVNVLPLEVVLRVWDVMLFEQSPCILFRVLLTLLDDSTPAILACCDPLYLWSLVAKLPSAYIESSALVDSAMLQYASLDRCGSARVIHRSEL
jgi:hypothetical protein